MHRYSCIEVSVEKSPVQITQTPLINNHNKNGSALDKSDSNEYRRPPIGPIVRNTVITTIANTSKRQQQYGKSHPLYKLNVKPRHNNPVYNTIALALHTLTASGIATTLTRLQI
ncbi:hypothetical protein NQ317_007502 [Molorchus minor]|uniref:Uncharacterized protein n=1 Tax=Molorchus minor TaxID=1323400 RepID=A0ABQ9ISF9_9CUCU|nr:hypothetical protein NQ317_007502 [Molorchus minor]